MRDFSGKVAVITGAASGIGRALAAELAAEGCDIAVVDINDDGLQGTERLVTPTGRRITRHIVDVSDRGAMEALPDAVLDAHGRVDIVVNNAGVSVAATLDEHTIEDFEWLVGINFWGVVYGSKFFLPHLRRSDDAYIVNLSSMFGLVGVPGQSSYCATKFAIRGFSEAIAAELAETPVRVLSVHPGGISTNIARATRWAASHLHLRDGAVRFFEQRTMPADKAAAIIIDAMKRRRARVLIGREAYATDYLKRMVPVLPPRVLQWARKRLGPQ